MKAYILCACSIILLAHTAHAQCKLHRNMDEFTHKRSTSSDKVKIIKHGESPILKSFDKTASTNCFYKIYLEFVSMDGKMFLAMSEESDNCISHMQKMELRLEDGSVITKNNPTEGNYKQKEGTGVQYTMFEITAGELAELAASQIAKVRITNDGTDHQVIKEEIDDKPAASIKEYAACMQPYMRKFVTGQ